MDDLIDTHRNMLGRPYCLVCIQRKEINSVIYFDEIEDALEKIDNDDYTMVGTCESCGSKLRIRRYKIVEYEVAILDVNSELKR